MDPSNTTTLSTARRLVDSVANGTFRPVQGGGQSTNPGIALPLYSIERPLTSPRRKSCDQLQCGGIKRRRHQDRNTRESALSDNQTDNPQAVNPRKSPIRLGFGRTHSVRYGLHLILWYSQDELQPALTGQRRFPTLSGRRHLPSSSQTTH